MNSQLLLLINFLVVTALVMYFLSARLKGKQGPTLDLKNSGSPEKSEKSEISPEFKEIREIRSDAIKSDEIRFDIKPENIKAADPKIEESDAPNSPQKVDPASVEVQELTGKREIIYFVYNGHEWEAHEILGLESGVSLHEATQHYQNLIKTSDPSTFEFYDAAFAAILKLKRNKW